MLLTSGILNNVSKHPGNRTLLYRAELHEKGQAAASAQVRSRVLLPSLRVEAHAGYRGQAGKAR